MVYVCMYVLDGVVTYSLKQSEIPQFPGYSKVLTTPAGQQEKENENERNVETLSEGSLKIIAKSTHLMKTQYERSLRNPNGVGVASGPDFGQCKL